MKLAYRVGLWCYKSGFMLIFKEERQKWKDKMFTGRNESPWSWLCPLFPVFVISVIWLNVLLRCCLLLDSSVCFMWFYLESISLWRKHIWLLQNYEWVEKIKVPVLTVSDFILSSESIPSFLIQKRQNRIFHNLTLNLHMNVYHLSFEGFILPGSRPVLFTWARWRRPWSKLGVFTFRPVSDRL